MAVSNRGGQLGPLLKREFGLLGIQPLRLSEEVLPVSIVSDVSEEAQGYRFSFGQYVAGGVGTKAVVILGLHPDTPRWKSEGPLMRIMELSVALNQANALVRINAGFENGMGTLVWTAGTVSPIEMSDVYRDTQSAANASVKVPNASWKTMVDANPPNSTATAQEVVCGPIHEYRDVPGVWTLGGKQTLVIAANDANNTIFVKCRGYVWLP